MRRLGQGLALAAAALYLFFMMGGLSEVLLIGLVAAAFVVALLAPVGMLGFLVFLLLRGRPWSEIRKWLWALGCGLAGFVLAVALNAVFMLWLGSKEEDDGLNGERSLLLLFTLPLIPAFFGVGAYAGWGWGSGGRTTASGHSQRAS